jgi:peptide deformylase
MSKFNIVYATNPFLSQPGKDVTKVDSSMPKLIKDMFKTMYKEDGCGLAAPQIGIDKNIFVVDVSYAILDAQPMALINPKFTWASEKLYTQDEYCISVPGYGVKVTRPEEIKVNFLNEYGEPQSIHATGLLARCIQHENDHLKGITLLDYMSSLRRKIAVKKINKFEKILKHA